MFTPHHDYSDGDNSEYNNEIVIDNGIQTRNGEDPRKERYANKDLNATILKDTLEVENNKEETTTTPTPTENERKPHDETRFVSITYYKDKEFNEYIDKISIEVCIFLIFIHLFTNLITSRKILMYLELIQPLIIWQFSIY
jgi:hypothetical protein